MKDAGIDSEVIGSRGFQLRMWFSGSPCWRRSRNTRPAACQRSCSFAPLVNEGLFPKSTLHQCRGHVPVVPWHFMELTRISSADDPGFVLLGVEKTVYPSTLVWSFRHLQVVSTIGNPTPSLTSIRKLLPSVARNGSQVWATPFSWIPMPLKQPGICGNMALPGVVAMAASKPTFMFTNPGPVSIRSSGRKV